MFFLDPDYTAIIILAITMMVAGAARLLLAIFAKPKAPEEAPEATEPSQ